MTKKDKKVTFVFQRARNSRINEEIPFAKEMFYTYFHFLEEYETEIIEFGNFPEGRRYKRSGEGQTLTPEDCGKQTLTQRQ